MSPHEVAPSHTPLGRVTALAIGLAAIVAVIVLAFSWPSITADPHHLPIAITGPEQAVSAAEASVDDTQPGAIAFDEVADRTAAIDAIERREVYGAIVLGTEPEVLTSSASSHWLPHRRWDLPASRRRS